MAAIRVHRLRRLSFNWGENATDASPFVDFSVACFVDKNGSGFDQTGKNFHGPYRE